MSTDNHTPATTFIYALLDSRTGHVRYVGKSDDPDRRMLQHVHRAHNSHKNNWLRQLEREGLWPVLQILEECACDEWQDRERYWIAFFRDAGEPLTNKTDGGDGAPGYVFTEEDRANSSADSLARYADPEARLKLGAAHKAAWARTQDHAGRVAAMLAGRQTPEVHAKHSASMKARWLDPEYRAKVLAARAPVMASPEHRAKQSADGKARYADPAERARTSAATRAGIARRAAAKAANAANKETP